MTEVLFNGHAGRLEGRYHQSEKPGAPIALICIRIRNMAEP